MARTDDPHPLIKRLRAMGMSDSVIFNRLILEGWSETDITHAFEPKHELIPQDVKAALTHGAAPVQTVNPTEIPPSAAVQPATARRFPLTTLAIVALIGAAVIAAFSLYIKPPIVYSISIMQHTAASSTAPLSYGALPALSDPTYYSNVKKTLMDQKASFIDANLSQMQLTVFVDGDLKLQVSILAKGRVGSWWETPAGIYKIETKEKMHFNNLEQVSMPYSLDFDGNFFIHGWPTYADGTPVATTYSGGCIRLSTDDSAKVYALADVGEPVVVHNEDPPIDAFNYTLKAPPVVSADAYLVADLDSGVVLTQKNASDEAAIASVTKLITALVATEYINLDKMVTVPPEAIVYTTVPRLRAGQEVRAYDLLFLLLQESSNEAAETLAAAVGRDQFIEDMNKKADAIGLTDTTLNDPSGVKADLSTAENLYKLLKYIYGNRRFVFDITTGELTDSAYGRPSFQNIADFNIIKDAPWAKLVGGKIGETPEAGQTYAGIFDVPIGDTDRHLAVIVLGSKDSPKDVSKLLNFVHSAYAPAQ